MTGRALVAVARRHAWALGIVVVLVACEQAPPRATAPSAEEWAPVRHLVDDLAAERGEREGRFETIDHAARYVLAGLPAEPLVVDGDSVTGAAGGTVDVKARCPASLAGRVVGLSVAGVPTPPAPVAPAALQDELRVLATVTLQAPPRLSCPADPSEAVTIPLSGLPAGLKTSPTIVATDEPPMTVESPWLPLPDDAILRLSLGLADPSSSHAAAPARFRIRAEHADGRSVSLLDRILDPVARSAERGWVEERIPLTPAVRALGSTVKLVFETARAGERGPIFPLWGDPVILGRSFDRSLERRNVVLVSVDTLRADSLGCYGALPTNAPALDRLATEGTIFMRAFAAAPWTLPSHTTMLTGTLGCVHSRGVRFGPLPTGITPLAEILRRAGYTTAAYTENAYLTADNFQRGFGSFEAYMTPGTWEARGEIERTVGKGRAWIERHAHEPFFLFLHTYQVHAPYQAPPPFGDLLGERVGGNLVSRAPEAQAAQDRAKYDQEVRYADSVLGTLVETIDALGLAQKTILVVTSDHGEAFGEHERFGHVGVMEEEVTHVPFIWRAPGLIAAGRQSPVVASLADLVPTVLDLVGLPTPALAGGASLAQFLRDVDPPNEQQAIRVAFTESMLLHTYPLVVRGRNWRARFDGAERPEMHFLSDGRELRVAESSPAVRNATTARGRYEVYCRRFSPLAAGAAPAPPRALTTPEQLRALRALGYVQ